MHIGSGDSLARAKALQKVLRLKFRNLKRLSDALTHTSAANIPEGESSPYQRLEFFGDAILNFVICEKLYHMLPDADEGTLSRMRSALVSKKMLARIAQTLTLGRFIITGSNEKNELRHPKMLADTLEALISTVYFDHGLGTSREFICKHWLPYFDERKIARLDPNPKSTLQEIVQKTFRILPHYETTPALKGFTAVVSCGTKLRGKGKGHSKKEAEEKAAVDLLKKLKGKKRHALA